MFKIVAFVNETQDAQVSYMTEQLGVLKTTFPTIETELANHDDARLTLYCQHSRLPCLMMFYDGHHKTHKHAKLSHKKAVTWVKQYSSL